MSTDHRPPFGQPRDRPDDEAVNLDALPDDPPAEDIDTPDDMPLIWPTPPHPLLRGLDRLLQAVASLADRVAGRPRRLTFVVPAGELTLDDVAATVDAAGWAVDMAVEPNDESPNVVLRLRIVPDTVDAATDTANPPAALELLITHTHPAEQGSPIGMVVDWLAPACRAMLIDALWKCRRRWLEEPDRVAPLPPSLNAWLATRPLGDIVPSLDLLFGDCLDGHKLLPDPAVLDVLWVTSDPRFRPLPDNVPGLIERLRNAIICHAHACIFGIGILPSGSLAIRGGWAGTNLRFTVDFTGPRPDETPCVHIRATLRDNQPAERAAMLLALVNRLNEADDAEGAVAVFNDEGLHLTWSIVFVAQAGACEPALEDLALRFWVRWRQVLVAYASDLELLL